MKNLKEGSENNDLFNERLKTKHSPGGLFDGEFKNFFLKEFLYFLFIRFE